VGATITSKEALKILNKSGVKSTVIIDIHRMNNKFLKIKEFLCNPNRLKIFYNGNEKIFDDMVGTFKLQGRKDFKYAGKRLTTRVACNITAYYLYHYRKS